jgi:SagB-type dehydrogenase family enzyme
MRRQIVLACLLLVLSASGMAKEGDVIKLPLPDMSGGMPLMQALKARHSTREFSNKPLPANVLSNLLWAAAGVNRPESGKRTAPSARDWREIDVYVAMADGVYRYEPGTHTLRSVLARDIRALTGTQDFVASVPINLIYVADLRRMAGASADSQALYAAADTGLIAQNVYLFCAASGLGTVVRGSVDREALATALGLSAQQSIILAQSVGYPAAAAGQ